VPTAHWRVLFGLDVRAHHRREVVHFNVTEHPPAAWTAQSIVEAFPDDTASSYLLRDRDTIYGHAFRHGVKGMGNRRLRFQNIHPAGPGRVEGRAIASGHTYPKWAGRLIKDELHKTGWRLAALLDLIVP
jgi:hypothetical protein